MGDRVATIDMDRKVWGGADVRGLKIDSVTALLCRMYAATEQSLRCRMVSAKFTGPDGRQVCAALGIAGGGIA